MQDQYYRMIIKTGMHQTPTNDKIIVEKMDTITKEVLEVYTTTCSLTIHGI